MKDLTENDPRTLRLNFGGRSLQHRRLVLSKSASSASSADNPYGRPEQSLGLTRRLRWHSRSLYSIVAVLDVAAVSEERHYYDLIQYHLESAGGSCRQQRCRRSAGRMPALERRE